MKRIEGSQTTSPSKMGFKEKRCVESVEEDDKLWLSRESGVRS